MPIESNHLRLLLTAGAFYLVVIALAALFANSDLFAQSNQQDSQTGCFPGEELVWTEALEYREDLDHHLARYECRHGMTVLYEGRAYRKGPASRYNYPPTASSFYHAALELQREHTYAWNELIARYKFLHDGK